MIRPFIHLRSLSSYSLSESTLKINNLVSLAKKNEMPAIAITDNNNMFGVFEFSQECIKNNIQPIIGTSVNLLNVKNNHKISQLTFLAKNEKGYRNLLNLSSLSHLNDYRDVGIKLDQIENHTDGLYCFIGGIHNPLLLLNKDNKKSEIKIIIEKLKNYFSDNFLFEIQRIKDPSIDSFENEFIELSHKFDIPLIGSNNIKYGKKEDFSAHDALLCIAQKSTINNSQREVSNENIYFKSSEEMINIFNDIPEIHKNNLNIALSCNFFPEETKPKFPKFQNDKNLTAEEYLLKYSKEGMDRKIKLLNLSNSNRYIERLNYEFINTIIYRIKINFRNL